MQRSPQQYAERARIVPSDGVGRTHARRDRFKKSPDLRRAPAGGDREQDERETGLGPVGERALTPEHGRELIGLEQ
jgi:hypothetical protein